MAAREISELPSVRKLWSFSDGHPLPSAVHRCDPGDVIGPARRAGIFGTGDLKLGEGGAALGRGPTRSRSRVSTSKPFEVVGGPVFPYVVVHEEHQWRHRSRS